MGNKTCAKCGESKDETTFEIYRNGKRGNVCGSCRYKARKLLSSWDERKRKATVSMRKWREDNPEYHKQYFQDNKDYFNMYYAQWREDNKEHLGNIHSAARKANRYAKTRNINQIRCQSCGAESKHRHHQDYQHPYLVTFLCIKCHRGVHSGLIKCPEPIDLKKMAGAKI